MALNPPVHDSGEPFRIENEHFIMHRSGIDFEIKIEGLGKMKGSGRVTRFSLDFAAGPDHEPDRAREPEEHAQVRLQSLRHSPRAHVQGEAQPAYFWGQLLVRRDKASVRELA